jgi:RimJ/RimL family protein N-acetyltransferase
MIKHTKTCIQNLCDRVTIQQATSNDSRNIWEWRNNKETKKMSITTDSISWEAHSNWYKKSLVNEDCYLYVGHLNNDKIGICRFDIDGNTNSAKVSINLNPQFRNKNLSHQLLAATIKVFLQEKNILLTATIKKNNIGSEKCFIKVGFVFEREDDEYNYFKYYQ